MKYGSLCIIISNALNFIFKNVVEKYFPALEKHF